MDRRAIDKARNRLHTAKREVGELSKIRTPSQFDQHWYVFLTAAKNIYTLLETGAKVSPQSRQWFGQKNQQRRDDPLLQYIYQARDDEEHGLGNSVETTPEVFEIGVSVPHGSQKIVVNGPGMRNVTIENVSGTAVSFIGGPPPPGFTFTPMDGRPIVNNHRPSRTILAPVVGRGPVTYNPPTEHLGQPLVDNSPIAVASLAISYLERLIEEAELRA